MFDRTIQVQQQDEEEGNPATTNAADDELQQLMAMFEKCLSIVASAGRAADHDYTHSFYSHSHSYGGFELVLRHLRKTQNSVNKKLRLCLCLEIRIRPSLIFNIRILGLSIKLR